MIVYIIVIGIVTMGIYADIIGTDISFGSLNHKHLRTMTIPTTIHIMTVPFICGDVIISIPMINSILRDDDSRTICLINRFHLPAVSQITVDNLIAILKLNGIRQI